MSTAATALSVICGAGVGLGFVVMVGGARGQQSGSHQSTENWMAQNRGEQNWRTRNRGTQSSWAQNWRAQNSANTADERRSGRATPLAGLALFNTEISLRRLAIAAGAGVLVGAATGWPVGALLAAVAGWALPGVVAPARTQAAAIARIEAMASWAEMLRDTLAGAAGIEQAISASAPVAPLPIREDVGRLALRLERERLAPALRSFADEVADPTCDLVVAALVLAAEHQAQRLGELLGTLAQAARDQATMRLRVETGRARTRTSVRVVVGTTVGLALGMVVLNHGYLSPYDTPLGQMMLLLVGLFFAGGITWLTRMARPVQPARLVGRSFAGSRSFAGNKGSTRPRGDSHWINPRTTDSGGPP